MTRSGFVAGFLMCSFGLLGQQTHVTLGVGWLVISLTTLFTLCANEGPKDG
jgi:hypothetical protein